MAALGLSPDDYEEDAIVVWPENQCAYQLFTRLQTQWRTGMNGPTGLDYNVLLHEIDRMHLDTLSYDELFCDIRVMESAAINEIYRKN